MFVPFVDNYGVSENGQSTFIGSDDVKERTQTRINILRLFSSPENQQPVTFVIPHEKKRVNKNRARKYGDYRKLHLSRSITYCTWNFKVLLNLNCYSKIH